MASGMTWNFSLVLDEALGGTDRVVLIIGPEREDEFVRYFTELLA